MPTPPVYSSTRSPVISSSPALMHCSSKLSASLTEPSALRAIIDRASVSIAMSFSLQILPIPSTRSFSDTCLKLSVRQRDLIVGLIFSGLVVASMNITCSGGSSSVLRKAFSAESVSICASSIIYTLYSPTVGGYCTDSVICLRLSTPLLEAASSSTTSRNLPAVIALQLAHSPHGRAMLGSSQVQLTAFARILAVVVLPVPLVPANR